MKGKRIPEAKRDWIQELRESGLSIREIAAVTGIPRSTVVRICHEERAPIPDSKRPLGRCPRCGRLVRLPCYACWLETAPESRKRAWRAAMKKLERYAMDLVKEFQELKQAIKDAMEDGRLNVREVVKIAREAADVLEILIPLIVGKTGEAEAKAEKAA
jgi:DNA-binding IclR family transcriptional regulator